MSVTYYMSVTYTKEYLQYTVNTTYNTRIAETSEHWNHLVSII